MRSDIGLGLTTLRYGPLRPMFRAGSGGEGDRTPDLLNAIQALSQLSYAPVVAARTLLHTHDRNKKSYPTVSHWSRRLTGGSPVSPYLRAHSTH